MKQSHSKPMRATASIIIAAMVCTTISAASANTALAEELSADTNVYESIDAQDAELAALPAVFAGAFVAAAGAFALKAVYDVGVAAGEWAARQLVGQAAADSELAVEGLLAQNALSADSLLD